jgi:hypothetical protein
MRLTPILLALTAILLLTACANSDEVVPTNSPTSTAVITPTPANAVVFCPQIGNSSTPITPTPEPSCDPGDTDPRVEIADGLFSKEATPPPLPVGTTQLSNYFEFESSISNVPGLTISVPLGVKDRLATIQPNVPPDTLAPTPRTTVPPGTVPYWYTHSSDGWTRLFVAHIVADASVNNQPSATDSFHPVPANLIVLAATS